MLPHLALRDLPRKDGEEKKAAWNTLPQAHTCSNTLELPNYCDAWQWGRLYERDGGTERQSDRATETERPWRSPPANLSVEELAGINRGRLLTAACGSQGLHSTNSEHLCTCLCCMHAPCLHSQRNGIERDPVLQNPVPLPAAHSQNYPLLLREEGNTVLAHAEMVSIGLLQVHRHLFFKVHCVHYFRPASTNDSRTRC